MPRIRQRESIQFSVFGFQFSDKTWKLGLFLSAAMALALVAPTLDAGACPYCPPTDATLSEKLSESDAACIVNFLDAKNGAELSMQTTRFQVIQLMKPSPHCKVDEIITVPQPETGAISKIQTRTMRDKRKPAYLNDY